MLPQLGCRRLGESRSDAISTQETIPTEDLIQRIREYAEKHGRTPKSDEMPVERAILYKRHKIKWSDAVTSAGLEPVKKARMPAITKRQGYAVRGE